MIAHIRREASDEKKKFDVKFDYTQKAYGILNKLHVCTHQTNLIHKG